MEEELIVENSGENAKEQKIFSEANIPQQTRKYCIFQADSLLNWFVGWIRLVIFTFSLFIFATSVVSLNRLAIGNEDLVVFNTTISSEKNENATLQYFVVDATDAPYEYELFWYGWRLAFNLIISGLICLDSVIVLVNKLGTRWRRLSEGGVRERLYTHFQKSTLEYLASWSGLTYQVFRLILHVLLASAYTCTNYTSALLYFTTVADGFYMGRWIILALSGLVFLLSFLHHPWLNRKNEPLVRVFERAKEDLIAYFKWDKNNFKRDPTRLANHLILSAWLVLWGITYIIAVASQETLCGDYVEIVNMILKLGVMIFYLLHSLSALGNSTDPIHPLNGWLFLYTVAQLVPEYNVSRDEVLSLIGLVQIIGLLSFGVYEILFFWQYDAWKHKLAKTKHEEKAQSDHKVHKINKLREVITRITSAAAFVLIVPGLFLAVIGLFQPWYELDFEWNVAIPDLLDLTVDIENFFDPLMDALGIFDSIFNTEVVCPIFYGAVAVVVTCTLAPYPCPGVSIARDLAGKAVDLKKLAKKALWLKNRFVKIVRTAVRLRSLIPRNLPITSIAPLSEKYFFLVFLVVTPVFTSVAGIAIAFWYRRGNRGKWINWVLGAIAMLIINVLSLILNFAIPYIIDEIVGEIPLISVKLIRLPGFYMVIASHVLVIISVVLFLISTLVAEEGDYSEKFGGNVLVQKQAKLATLQSSKVHNKYLTRTKLAGKTVYRRIQLLPLSWLLSVSVVVFGTVIGTIPLQSDLFSSEYNPLNQVIQVNQTLTEIEEMISAFKTTLDDISPPCPLIPLEYIFKAAVTLFDDIPDVLNKFEEAVVKVIALFNIPFRVLSRAFNLLFVAAPIFNCIIIVIGWFGATTGEKTQQKTAYMIGKITIMSLQMVMSIYQIVGTIVNNIPLLSTIFAIKSAYLYSIVAHVFSLFAIVFLMIDTIAPPQYDRPPKEESPSE